MGHTKRPQNSTIAGGASLLGMVLFAFGNVEIADTFSAVKDMKWEQLLPILLAVGGSLRAIFMKEK